MCGSLDKLTEIYEDVRRREEEGAGGSFPSWFYCFDLDCLGQTVTNMLCLPIDQIDHNEVAAIYDAVMSARLKCREALLTLAEVS